MYYYYQNMSKLKQALSTKDEQLPQKTKTSSTEFMFFIVINVLLVGISTWQTFIGYKADVAGNIIIAITIAIASGVLFLAMNFEIRNRRLAGKSHLLLIVMYLIPLAISFPGNFNAFYSNQTEAGFLKDETNNYHKQLTQTNKEAVEAINGSANLVEFELNFNSRMDALDIEFHKAPSGWGSMAQQRWVELLTFLNENGANLKTSVLGQTNNDKLRFDRAKTAANKEKDNIINSRRSKTSTPLTNIKNWYSPIDQKMDSIRQQPTQSYSSILLDDIVNAENNIRAEAASILGRNDIFSTTPLTISREDDTGKIKHTMEKVFNWEEPSAIIFSLFFSLIIDLAALVYILVFIPYQSQQGKGRISNGAQRI